MSSTAAEPSAVPGEKLFTVTLFGFGDRKFQVIKVLLEVSPGLGLSEARHMVDTAPRTVLSGLPRADAEAARRRLAQAGALVGIK